MAGGDIIELLDRDQELIDSYESKNSVRLFVLLSVYRPWLIQGVTSRLVETYNTSRQSAYHKWVTEKLFDFLPVSDQCSLIFERFNDVDYDTEDIDPKIHLRYGLIQFLRLFDLLKKIPSYQFTSSVSRNVLNCESNLGTNFLASFTCFVFQQPNTAFFLPDYVNYFGFVLGVCLALDIISLTGGIHIVIPSSTPLEAHIFSNLSKAWRHVMDQNEETLEEFNGYHNNNYLDVIASWNGYEFTYVRQNFPENQIELVDYSDYTPVFQRGVENIELYSMFFDKACEASSNKLDALKRVVSSYASVMSLIIPTELSETRNGICQWLKEEQQSMSRVCTNAIEPFTQLDVKDIPLLFLWRHKTPSGHIQCYDLLSLRDYLQTNDTNPFTREIFRQDEIKKINDQYTFVIALMRTVLT